MLLLSSLLVGCFGASQFDGTWLFAFDAQYEYDGDCGQDENDPVYTGSENTWVDMYKTGDGGLVVLLGESLVGTVEGKSLAAEWTYEIQSESYASQEKIELDGELAGGELTGDVSSTSQYVYEGDDPVSCKTTGSYTAWKTTTGPDEIAGN